MVGLIRLSFTLELEMPYSLADLEIEITNVIEHQKASGNARIPADWVAHAVMAAHPRIGGEDKDFYTICSYRTVRETTRRVMSKYRNGETAGTEQTSLEGFDFLQKYYVVTEKDDDGDDQQVQLHVDVMTYEQLTAKALEHHAVGVAHLKHRDEIYRFRDAKFSRGGDGRLMVD
jgi:hypothetical protein